MRSAIVALLVLWLALPAWATEPRPATLRLKDLTPLVVQGRGFLPRERVVVTVSLLSRQRRIALAADREGRFTGRFRLHPGRCAEVTVRAVGAAGTRAILQIEPDC